MPDPTVQNHGGPTQIQRVEPTALTVVSVQAPSPTPSIFKVKSLFSLLEVIYWESGLEYWTVKMLLCV